MQPASESESEPAHRSPGSLAEFLVVAVPLAVSCGSIAVQHVVDRLFLTWHSTEALAAVMPAGMLYWTVIGLAIGICNYINTFVAQYEGAGRKQRVAASLWQGTYFAIAAGILLTGTALFSRQIFAAIGHDASLQPLESAYFRVMAWGTVPLLASEVLSCFFVGRGQTWTILWVNLACTAVNIVLDYAWIFGFWGFPAWGIEGAAAATASSWVVKLALYAGLIAYIARDAGYPLWEARKPDGELLRRILRFGFPAGLHQFLDIICFTLFIQLIGMMGTDALAATSLAFTLNTMAFVPMFGVGIAVMTLVGKRIGEGRPELAVRTTWLAMGLSAAYMLGFAVVYLLAPHWILSLYSSGSDPEAFAQIRGTVVLLLRFVAVYSLFDAMAIVFSSAVRGAGDTRWAMVYSLICCVALMVLPTWLMWHYWGGSLLGSWLAVTVCLMALAVGFLLRFLGGKWKSMRVIEPFDIDSEPPSEPSEEDAVAEPQWV